MIPTKFSFFRFADVTVREREFAIVKAGQVQQVEPKAFRVLLILIRNPNKLIAKEELLTGVWGDTAVTENSLARNIALLRRLLGDDPHERRFIETVSSIGYRFVCPVEASEEREENAKRLDGYETLNPNGRGGVTAANEIGLGSPNGKAIESPPVADAAPPDAVSATPQVRLRRRGWALAGAASAAVLVAGAAWYLLRPLPPPHITEYKQLTHDGHEKWPKGTDGNRVYFWHIVGGPISQVVVSGGEIAPVPVALPKVSHVESVSPDGSSLIVDTEEKGVVFDRPQWIVSVLGNPLHRLPDGAQATFPRMGRPWFTPPATAASGWFKAMALALISWPLLKAPLAALPGRRTEASSDSARRIGSGRCRRTDRTLIRC